MHSKREINLLFMVFVIFVLHHVPITGNEEENGEIKHETKRAMTSMFKDILTSIKKTFVSGKTSKDSDDSGESKSDKSSNSGWKNMIPDIAKAFIPDEEEGQDNKTSTEDIKDDRASSNVTELDPQATKINAGITENMGDNVNGKQKSVLESDNTEVPHAKNANSDSKDDKKPILDINMNGMQVEKPEKQESTTIKQDLQETSKEKKVNAGITENNGDNVEPQKETHHSSSEVYTSEKNEDDNSEENIEEKEHMSWENESQEDSRPKKDQGSPEKRKTGGVKVNAGITENTGENVKGIQVKPHTSTSADGGVPIIKFKDPNQTVYNQIKKNENETVPEKFHNDEGNIQSKPLTQQNTTDVRRR